MVIIKNGFNPFDNEIQNVLLENGNVIRLSNEHLKEYEFNKDDSLEIIDANKRIMINGFVDKHTHLDKSNLTMFTRNETGSLEEAISKTQSLKQTLTEEELFKNAELTLLKMINHGVVTVRTHVDVDKYFGFKGLNVVLKLKEKYEDDINIEIVAFPQEGFISDEENYKYFIESMTYDIDYVGGIPLNDSDQEAHIDKVFELAEKHNLGIDMHIDESDDVNDKSILYVIEVAKKYQLKQGVYVGHICSFITETKDRRSNIINDMKEANINVISLPSTNLYLQGRHDEVNVRRGIAPVKEFLKEGVNVYIGSDNYRDLFNPFGNGNMLEEALVAAHACHMGSPAELTTLFKIVSVGIFDIENTDYKNGRLVLIDSTEVVDAIIDQASLYQVIKY